jgi:hypothetical protein
LGISVDPRRTWITMLSQKLTTNLQAARGENPALSYRNLRAIIGVVGLTLPIVLLLAGVVDGHIESSISAYYYSKVGNLFTGALCVIGVFLLAYRFGSLAIENVATTLAGVCALGVAFFHAAPENATLSELRLANVHLACAAGLFVLLGAISLFVFPTDVPPNQRWRANSYMGLGALIWVSIILMPTLNTLASGFYDDNHIFFILETICVVAFAVSFILKGHGQLIDPRFTKMAEQPVQDLPHTDPPTGGEAASPDSERVRPTIPERQPPSPALAGQAHEISTAP